MKMNGRVRVDLTDGGELLDRFFVRRGVHGSEERTSVVPDFVQEGGQVDGRHGLLFQLGGGNGDRYNSFSRESKPPT